ncbi:MAG: peptidylprolyl isomerase [Desulfuromonadaceae bacterium]|nr:peptidylprolyl isomerase [Desulfuromonadaceae bacterium]
MSEAIKNGDTITVNYTGKFEDGNVFDTSEGKEPLKFTVGSGQLIKGFDDAVTGMVAGDKKTVTMTPADAYGELQDGMIIDIPKSQIPEDMKLEIGQRLHLRDPQGQPVPAMVAEITEESVKMDANHPMAGKTLIFDLEIVETGLEADAPSCDEGGEEGEGGHVCTGCGKH